MLVDRIRLEAAFKSHAARELDEPMFIQVRFEHWSTIRLPQHLGRSVFSFVSLRFQVVGNVMPFADIPVLASMCAPHALARANARRGRPTVVANHTVT